MKQETHEITISGFKKNGVENENNGQDSSFQYALTASKHIHVFQCVSIIKSFFWGVKL